MKVTFIITHKYRNGGTVDFTADSSSRITEHDAVIEQFKAGYHPTGYGFFGFKTGYSEIEKGYIAHWSCYESCE